MLSMLKQQKKEPSYIIWTADQWGIQGRGPGGPLPPRHFVARSAEKSSSGVRPTPFPFLSKSLDKGAPPLISRSGSGTADGMAFGVCYKNINNNGNKHWWEQSSARHKKFTEALPYVEGNILDSHHALIFFFLYICLLEGEQYSVAKLLRHWFIWLQHCSNIAMLCCAKNRRCKSSRVTLAYHADVLKSSSRVPAPRSV